MIATSGFLTALECTGRGSAPDSAGGAHDAPPDSLVGWGGGYPLPIPYPPRHLRRLDLVAYGDLTLRLRTSRLRRSVVDPPSSLNFPPMLGGLDKTLI